MASLASRRPTASEQEPVEAIVGQRAVAREAASANMAADAWPPVSELPKTTEEVADC